jgi:hypothetical protein
MKVTSWMVKEVVMVFIRFQINMNIKDSGKMILMKEKDN